MGLDLSPKSLITRQAQHNWAKATFSKNRKSHVGKMPTEILSKHE